VNIPLKPKAGLNGPPVQLKQSDIKVLSVIEGLAVNLVDYVYNLTGMRYEPDHKQRTRRRIVESASRQFRSEGMNGPGVAKLMKATGLTVGGFYKHFRSKNDLMTEAIDASVSDVSAEVARWAEQARAGEAWKEIVKRYLSMEHCEHPGKGCPVAALSCDIARTRPTMKRKIQASMKAYKKQLVEFMPGASPGEKQRNFTLIFTSMVGALSIARTLPEQEEKAKLLGVVRDHLLASF
jgi:TetR/AcrR family transcriptional repressor of nem operon